MDSLEQRAKDIVNREVLVCVSSLVSTLAEGANRYLEGAGNLSDLCDQAFELGSPVLDYEETARQAGWKQDANGGWFQPEHDTEDDPPFATAEEVFSYLQTDPYEWEVFEHWAVSGWLADSLEAVGEKVDKDFAGMCVWARTTTGQAIYMDSAIAKVLELSDKRLEALEA